MKNMASHDWLLLALLTGFGAGCADDRASTTPVATTSQPATSDSTSSTDSTGTTDTETAAGEDELIPWHGVWYTLYPDVSVNAPVYWGEGGDSFGFTLFELRAGSASIRVESCLWGSLRYDYMTVEANGGTVELEPVGGVHEFKPHGEIDRLYILPGTDCSSLVVKEVGMDGEEGDLFSSSGGPLARGELCLEKCAEAEGQQGLISDCGTPVPWECTV